MMCLPFKVFIGNYIESIEKGADTIIITGSCGPCRFGFYSLMQEDILKDLGYDIDMIVIDSLREGYKEFFTSIRKITNSNSISGLYKNSRLALDLIQRADNLTQKSNYVRAYAIDKNEVNRIMDGFLEDSIEIHGSSQLIDLINKTEAKLNNVKQLKNYNPIKIGIIGEIYTIIEPFVNLDIEKKLGNLGVLVDKSLTPTKWLEHHVINFPFGSKYENTKYKLAEPYLNTLVGGHGRETIGSAIYYKNMGYDGVIQILPLNCMPEIVAKSILKNVSKDLDFPIMTLVVDEMTGEAGYITRLEAFVDLLSKRREKQIIG
ncbi:MAG: CoA protein activase [Tissierellaceae bacterium]|nr:CoA protein activase [Tissierellaceae bacterium]